MVNFPLSKRKKDWMYFSKESSSPMATPTTMDNAMAGNCFAWITIIIPIAMDIIANEAGSPSLSLLGINEAKRKPRISPNIIAILFM